MIESDVRFHPPERALPPGTAWVLLRAFAPAGAPCDHPTEPVEAHALAVALDLAARIAARQPPGLLASELGPVPTRELMDQYRSTAAFMVRLLGIARRVAREGHELALPVVFLKSTALHLAGATAAGSRMAADIDVLVADRGAVRLAAALAGSGFMPSGEGPGEHQLVPLVHRDGGMIEIHTKVPGLRLPGMRSWPSATDLLEAGLCQPAPGLAAGALIPRWPVLVVHALIHGLVQHGTSPHRYPLTRMLADLIDLGFGTAELARLLAEGGPWVQGVLSDQEIAAVAVLCDDLAQGEVAALLDPTARDGAACLLRHMVLGALDPEYQESLRVPSLLGSLTERPRLLVLGAIAFRALFLSRSQIDVIYGPQHGRAGYLKWRLLRPFDLMRRLVRYSRSWARSRSPRTA